jgi:hypothetical protein
MRPRRAPRERAGLRDASHGEASDDAEFAGYGGRVGVEVMIALKVNGARSLVAERARDVRLS